MSIHSITIIVPIRSLINPFLQSKLVVQEYLISFPYEKLDRNDYNLYIAFAKLMLENKDYGEFPLTYEA